MHKLYKKWLFSGFEEQLARKWPEFRREPLTGAHSAPSGERAYCWHATEHLRIYIFIWPHPKGRDKFFVEVGWSKLNRYPRPSIGLPKGIPLPPRGAREAYALDEVVDSLTRLWGDQGVGEWEIPNPMSGYDPVPESVHDFLARMDAEDALTSEEASLSVQRVLADVLDKLERFGIPYLRELVVTERGVPARAQRRLC